MVGLCSISRRRSMTSAAIAASLVLVVGCKPQAPSMPVLPPPPVTTAKPVLQPIMDYEETTGTTQAIETEVVQPQVSGYLEKVFFQNSNGDASPGAAPPKLREGDDIAAGTELFLIDPRPYEAVYDAAVADADRAKAALERLAADLARAENLRKTNNISVEEYDKIVAQRAEAAASLAAAKAQIKSAELNVEFTKIKSKIAGRLGRVEVTEGNLVTANVTKLTTIVREDPMYVYFQLPDTVVKRYKDLIQEGKLESARDSQVPVEIKLHGEEGFPHKGYVDYVDNQMNVQSASLTLRGRFENPKLNRDIRALGAGQIVNVRLPASRPYDALLVAERAILTDQGEKVVYVVDKDDTAHRRVVQLGKLHGQLRVVTSGLTADDRVIVNGLQRVRDGAKVQPKEGPMPGVTATEATTAPTTEMKNDQ